MNKFTAPTTKSIGKAMEISPPTTNPIRISGKNTKNVTTLKTPQVALKAKHPSKDHKEKYNKKQ